MPFSTLHWQLSLFVAALSVASLAACSAPKGDWEQLPAPPPISGHPLQERLDPLLLPFPDESWSVTAVANYAVSARVMRTERYWTDAMAKVSPLDFALAWGPASTEEVQQSLGVTQSGRWYRFRIRGERSPLPLKQLNDNMANTHLIPGSEDIKKFLLSIKKDEHVALQGYLVNVKGRNGLEFKTSLTRTDAGAGACEILYVVKATRIPAS